jgi:hypothetical protein
MAPSPVPTVASMDEPEELLNNLGGAVSGEQRSY